MFGPTPYSVRLGGDSHQYVNLWCGFSCIWSQWNTKVNRHRADEMLRFLDSAYRAGFDAGAVHAAAKASPPTDPTLPISEEPRSASFASATAALTREFPSLSVVRWDRNTVLAYTGPDHMNHVATISKDGRSWDRCSVKRHDAAGATT